MADGLAATATAAAPPGFRLNPKQVEKRALIATSATHLLDYGGSRGGKTFGWVRPIIQRAIMAPGSRHLICRFRQNAVKRSIRLDTFPKVMKLCFPSVPWEAKDSDGYVLIHTGHGPPSEIWFGGLDSDERIDKVLGAEYATIFPDEASEIAYEAILTLRTRLAQRAIITMGPRAGLPLRLKMFYSLNPTSRRHWCYRELILKESPIDGTPLPDPSNYGWMVTPPSDNTANLPEGYLDGLANLPRLQRLRFYDGVFQSDVEGALWRQSLFLRTSRQNCPPLERRVVAVDPSGAKSTGDIAADEIGIVAAGLGADGDGYLLEDASLRAGPAAWAKVAVATYHRHRADALVFEANYGGPMGKALIHSIDKSVNVKLVHARQGKHVRAEPVAGLYEERRVRHIGDADDWEDLEDQLVQFTTAGYIGPKSPDRGDAAIWALTELMLKSGGPAAVSGATRGH